MIIHEKCRMMIIKTREEDDHYGIELKINSISRVEALVKLRGGKGRNTPALLCETQIPMPDNDLQ